MCSLPNTIDCYASPVYSIFIRGRFCPWNYFTFSILDDFGVIARRLKTFLALAS